MIKKIPLSTLLKLKKIYFFSNKSSPMNGIYEINYLTEEKNITMLAFHPIPDPLTCYL